MEITMGTISAIAGSHPSFRLFALETPFFSLSGIFSRFMED
jgi:hypothetical protein